MKTSFINKTRNFFKTTLIGGIAALLPLAIVFLLFKWIVSVVQRYLEPLVNLVEVDTRLKLVILYVIAFAAILIVFFFIGIIIRTRIGRFFNNVLEEKYLSKIPGYSIARETVMHFFGKKKSFFSEVVIADVFNSGTLMTGFITDDFGEYITVFIPTGPNPTSGNIYHIPKDRVYKTSSGVDIGMKSIISCGAGSSTIFQSMTPVDK